MSENLYDYGVFLLGAIWISLSGVLAPGPVTAATIAAATTRRHAGAWIAVGHAVVEIPLMCLILTGIGTLFRVAGVKIGIGLVGGAFLLWMGVQTFRAPEDPAAKPGADDADPSPDPDDDATDAGGKAGADDGPNATDRADAAGRSDRPAKPNAARRADASGRHPLWTGVILTGGSPYFLIWWATIGLALATQAAEFGALAFAVFALVHWLCDLFWLEALSVATYQGSRLLGPRRQRVILRVCAVGLVLFGLKFVYDAVVLAAA